jgi:hypothetical protein
MLGRIPRIALRFILGYFRRLPPGGEATFEWLVQAKEAVLSTELAHAIAQRKMRILRLGGLW